MPGPCQLLASEPGPFVPYDVDGGRVVAAGDNAVVLLDGTGTRITTVPVHAAAAALWGDDLVVLVPGGLRHYATATGAPPCAGASRRVGRGPCGFGTQTYLCPDVQLRLCDTARGLAVYTLRDEVHLVRLSEGTDTLLERGSAARFVDTGLVYVTNVDDAAYPTRIVFIPDGELPD